MPVTEGIPGFKFGPRVRMMLGLDRYSAPQTLRAVCTDAFGHVFVRDGDTKDMKRAAVSASAADNTLVAAVPLKKIRVHQCYLRATASCSVRFESETGGTALTGVMPVIAGGITAVLSGSDGVLCLPYSPLGWFETAAGSLLNLELSTSSVFGMLGYTEVD